MIEARYEVTVQIDADLWEINYSPDGDVSDDVRSYVKEVLEETVAEWLRRTGNSGSITVVPK